VHTSTARRRVTLRRVERRKVSRAATKGVAAFNFKTLGFIEYDGELPLNINSSLLSVVLHD